MSSTSLPRQTSLDDMAGISGPKNMNILWLAFLSNLIHFCPIVGLLNEKEKKIAIMFRVQNWVSGSYQKKKNLFFSLADSELSQGCWKDFRSLPRRNRRKGIYIFVICNKQDGFEPFIGY